VTIKKLFPGSRLGTAAAYAALIVYCSLYPFTGWRLPDQPLFSFLTALPPAHVSKSDLLTNLLAYIPLGFLLERYLSSRRSDLAPAFAATIAGTLISFLMESLQMFLPSRTASNIDLASNAAGTLFGAAIAVLAGSDIPLLRPVLLRVRRLENEIAPPALLAVALWAGSQLTPFVPSMDVSSVRAGLAPLWHQLVGPNRILEMGKVISTALDVGALAILISIFSRRPRRASAFFFHLRGLDILSEAFDRRAAALARAPLGVLGSAGHHDNHSESPLRPSYHHSGIAHDSLCGQRDSARTAWISYLQLGPLCCATGGAAERR